MANEINQIKIGTTTYNITSPNLEKYLPLSGGIMTGSITPVSSSAPLYFGSSSNFWKGIYSYETHTDYLYPLTLPDITVNCEYFNLLGTSDDSACGAILSIGDSHTRGLIFEGYVNVNEICHYDTDSFLNFSGPDFNFVGGLEDDLLFSNEDNPVFFGRTVFNIYGKLNIKNGADYINNGVEINAAKEYGTISLKHSNEQTVFISGSLSGDQDGYPRIDLYDSGGIQRMSLSTGWYGLKFFNWGQIGTQTNRMVIQDATIDLSHEYNYTKYKLWDDRNTIGYTPNNAQKMTDSTGSILTQFNDLNKIMTPGFYYCDYNSGAQSQTNVPCDVAYALQVYRAAGYIQIVWPYDDTNRFYARRYYNNVWKPWRQYNSDSVVSQSTTLESKQQIAVVTDLQSSVENQEPIIKSELSLDKCYDLIDKCQTIIYSLKGQTKEQIGMIAQEVEEFFPELIETDEQGYKLLSYSRLVVICFRVLKDLINRVVKLEEQ